jgi:hypothetical protein
MRLSSLLLLLAGASGARASDASGPEHGADPRMGRLAQPFTSEVYRLRIDLPPGFPLCGMAESPSSMEWFYVPVDPAARCDKFDLPMDWERWPDFVVIGPYVDAPMTIDTLDDYVRRETFFCAGKNPSIGSGMPRPSDVSTSIAPAENRLLGLNAVGCTRSDEKTNRYSKAFLAYKPAPGGAGHGYMVGTYARLKNREAAEHLLQQVARLLKPLN